MKLTNNWQTQWEQLPVPEKKVTDLIEKTIHTEKQQKRPSFTEKIRHFFQRPAYRRSVIAIVALVIIGIGGNYLFNYYRYSFSASDTSSYMAKDEAYVSENQETFIEENEEENASTTQAINSDKTAHYYDISKETTEFDEDTKTLQKMTTELGGYIENSMIDTSSYPSEARYATFVLRIPAEQTETFLEQIESLGTTIYENSSSENLSLTYSDNESRINALKAEETALLAMLEKSTTVEETLKVQEQLTRIRTEREQLTSENRAIDNRVDYATFTLNFNEITSIQQGEKSESALVKIKNNWQKQRLAWTNFFIQAGIFLASNLIYMLLLLMIIGGFVYYKKKK